MINRMDLTPSSTTNSPLFPSTPVFGDNVQDLLGTDALHVNSSTIITVNSTADAVDDSESGVTTLRDAINQANADTGSNLIVFDRSLFASQQTITLSLGELDIKHSLDIIAPRDELTGADLLTVSGNNASRVFEIEKETTVSLDGLIVADGLVTNDNGGGIKNSGTLTLDSSIVRNNNAINAVKSSLNGGGIYSTTNLTVQNSTISYNSAGSGGGIYNSGTSTVQNSTISDNRAGLGGGINNNTGINLVQNSTISGNSSDGNGGGAIYNSGNSTILDSTVSGNIARYTAAGILNVGISTIQNSTITGNSGGSAGIDNRGTIMVQNSTISGNSGSYYGAISNSNTSTITVQNSTISGNSGGNGGGIYNAGIITVQNSTISSNTARFSGGGIYNDYTGTATLLFSTVTQNLAANGGGLYQNDLQPSYFASRGSFNVRNTIIASNFNSTDGVNPDVTGTFTSNGYNLIGDSTGSIGFGVTGDIVGTSDNPIDPRLDTLAFHGGSTQTIALLADSPAIDAGDPTMLDTDPTTDQRGFPRVSGAYADIGAFEFSNV